MTPALPAAPLLLAFLSLQTPEAKPPLPPEIARIVELEAADSQVQPLLEELIRTFGPRLTSSTNLTKACEWARDRFASYGLDASLSKWGEYAVGFDRGVLEGAILAPVERPLAVGTNAWSPGTHGPTTGRAVAFPESVEAVRSALDTYKGAFVLVPRGRRLGPPGRKDSVEEALEEAGIAGYVTTEGGDLIHTDGRPPASFDKLPTRVTIKIQGKAHKEILDWIAEGKEPKLRFHIENRFVKGPISLYNVVADLRGAELPDEMVIVGGHIDSWDGAQGATDNGTGVASTLEVARLLSKLGVKPKRTIRFMLWSGEEQGLLGSRAWIRANPEVLPKISAVFVHDEGTNYAGGMVIPKSMRAVLEPALEPLTRLPSPFPFEFRHADGLPMGVGSDHDAFLAAGVPGFFWIQKGDVNYDRGHHTQYDTLDIVRHDYQRHTVKVVASTAWTVANLPALLPRENLTSSRRGGPAAAPGGKRLGIVPNDAEGGVGIDELTEGGAAARAGLQPGDLVVKLGEADVRDLESLRAALQKAPSKTTVTVKRGGKDLALEITWPEDARPASRPESGPAR